MSIDTHPLCSIPEQRAGVEARRQEAARPPQVNIILYTRVSCEISFASLKRNENLKTEENKAIRKTGNYL